MTRVGGKVYYVEVAGSLNFLSVTFLDSDEVLFTYHLTKFFVEITHWRRNLQLKILPVAWFYDPCAGMGKTVLPPIP